MRVLVLCHGNINRSVFCAAVLRRERPDWDVTSAGLKTKDGRCAGRKTREAAARYGLNLGDHRSTMCTWPMVEEADHTLYMDGGNERRLQSLVFTSGYRSGRAEDVWQRCHLLARYGSLRRIPDPNYTSDPVQLRRIYSVIETCTFAFVEAHK